MLKSQWFITGCWGQRCWRAAAFWMHFRDKTNCRNIWQKYALEYTTRKGDWKICVFFFFLFLNWEDIFLSCSITVLTGFCSLERIHACIVIPFFWKNHLYSLCQYIDIQYKTSIHKFVFYIYNLFMVTKRDKFGDWDQHT